MKESRGTAESERQMEMEVWSEALKGAVVPGGPGRMSPGRQRWGFSGCDGSTLKNTGMSFPPACALLSLSLALSHSRHPPSFIFYVPSAFLTLQFLYLLFMCCLTISFPLCSLYFFYIGIFLCGQSLRSVFIVFKSFLLVDMF